MHVSNPFTAGKRREARDQAVMDKHYTEREQREATRREAFRSQQRQAEYQRDMDGNPIRPSANSAKNLAERSKYQFEADSDDDEMENEIEGNLDLLHGAAGRLGQLGRAMGKEVDEQNRHIDRITGKVSRFVALLLAAFGAELAKLIDGYRRIRLMTRLLSTARGWIVSSRSDGRNSRVLQGGSSHWVVSVGHGFFPHRDVLGGVLASRLCVGRSRHKCRSKLQYSCKV